MDAASSGAPLTVPGASINTTAGVARVRPAGRNIDTHDFLGDGMRLRSAGHRHYLGSTDRHQPVGYLDYYYLLRSEDYFVPSEI